MSTLTELTDDVEADLKDVSNEVWSTTEISRAIARALREYNQVNPQLLITTKTLAADGWEIDISAITGYVSVTRVWFDYDASDPEHPPRYTDFEMWPGNILFIKDEDEPQNGDVLRIWYTKIQTINGLDGATATTVPLQDEEVIVLGATAYCALSEAVDSAGEVTVHPDDMTTFQKWGEARLNQFRSLLEALKQREVRKEDKRVGPWKRADVEDGI